VRPERAALGARQPAVHLARERELRLLARQRPLELLAQRSARAEDQRLDGAHAQPEQLGDLGVRAALELAHHERGALVERELAERGPDVLRARGVVGDERVGEVLLERDLVRPPGRLAKPLPADVVRDRDQPVARGRRALAAPVSAVRVQERGLGDVLCVGGVAKDREHIVVHVGDVSPVEALEGAVHPRPLRQQRRHDLVDT
jgi:hypothetical protein